MDKIVEEGFKLFPFARHVAAGQGLTYPTKDEIDSQYINDLPTPTGKINYDDLFEKAIGHITEGWLTIARGVLEDEKTYLEKIGFWDLDTGLKLNKNFVFWS